MLAAVVSTEWIRPESLSTPICTYRFAGLRLHSEIPLIESISLMYLWIPLTGFVFGGAWSRDQGGINDSALLHGHSTLLEVGLDRLKHLLAEVVLLK